MNMGDKMSREEQAVFTNMCMIYDEDRILVLNRIGKAWPGITFPGGHVEKGESFHDSVVREVYEETGLTIKQPILCGVKQFQNYQDARYVVFFYKTNQFDGKLSSSSEGEVFWIHKDELMNHKLASEFEQMFQVFISDELSEFYSKNIDGDWHVDLF